MRSKALLENSFEIFKIVDVRKKNEKLYEFNAHFLVGVRLLQKEFLSDKAGTQGTITSSEKTKLFVCFWPNFFFSDDERFNFEKAFPDCPPPKSFLSWVLKLGLLNLTATEQKILAALNKNEAYFKKVITNSLKYFLRIQDLKMVAKTIFFSLFFILEIISRIKFCVF